MLADPSGGLAGGAVGGGAAGSPSAHVTEECPSAELWHAQPGRSLS